MEIETFNVQSYTIYAIDGSVVKRVGGLDARQVRINLNDVDSGIYMLVAALDQGQYISEKIIKH